MFDATHYALREDEPRGRPWLTVVRDVTTGALATARFLVMLTGCVTLVGAAAIVTNASVRERLLQHVQLARWLDPTAAHTAADEPTPGGRKAAFDAKAEVEQRNITRYLARRYRVADEAVRQLVAAAYESGRHEGLDPLLILAVMAIESGMNPFAQSRMGAQGLMQVMTRVHTDKFKPHGGDRAALDPIANIKVGSAILAELIRRGGSVQRGLQLYVGAGNLPDDGGYGARVLAERGRIAMAAAGRIDAAIAAGYRASLAAESKPAHAAPKEALPAAAPSAAEAEGANKADRSV